LLSARSGRWHRPLPPNPRLADGARPVSAAGGGPNAKRRCGAGGGSHSKTFGAGGRMLTTYKPMRDGCVMENSFVHIGYPKSGSTSMQLDYFSRHPELFYLGPSTGGNDSAYYNAEIKYAIEIDLRVMKDFGYDPDRVRNVFESCHELFRTSGRKRFGFSSEGLSFTFHHDIDVTQKAERLLRIFGPTAKIIIVIRNQFALLRSLYRNSVVVGYSGTFQQFISDAFYNKGRSFIYDFDYHKMHSLYCDLFGKENVLVVPMEQLMSDSGAFCDIISDHIGVSRAVRDIGIKNRSQSDVFYLCLRELNAEYRSYMSASITQPIAQSRYLDYFSDVLGAPEPMKARFEGKLLDLLWTTAMDVTHGQKGKIDFSVPEFIGDWLVDYYGAANEMLSMKTGLDLCALGYPCRGVISDTAMPALRHC
jgi:hypothetical protein